MPTLSLRMLWSLLLLSLLAACGGSGGGGGSTGGLPAPGNLRIVVDGLPAGAAAAVTVTGPASFSQSLKASQTLANLAPGTYTVSAAGILNGTSRFGPQQASQAVTVSAGQTAGATVSYQALGSLSLALQQVVAGLASPIYLTAPDGDARLFVVERPGRIRIVQNGALLPTPFLDISNRVSTQDEQGLLSMAFHPQYAANGLFFVFYTEGNGDIAVERFRVSATDPNVADAQSETRILSIPHPQETNHYGGLLRFGPDGLLYIGTGDGGGEGDPFGNAQNLGSLLGKILRIDVDTAAPGLAYSIPAGNPFFNVPGIFAQIWAYGLRNPWRYAFDTAAGLLYVADVGGDRREEVDVVPTTQGGVNYGWNRMEGSLCFPPGAACNPQGLTLPVLEYTHDDGCAIVGGSVYRGNAIPELQGRYFYSDLCSGFLKSFVFAGGGATEQTTWPVPTVSSMWSFGEDGQHELYMISGNGTVFRIVRQ